MEPENKSERDYVLIQDIAECDRPREKALRMGVHSLDNAELMAIIFGNGIRGKSVLTMSQQLLAKQRQPSEHFKKVNKDNCKGKSRYRSGKSHSSGCCY